ncbi:MAG: redoxin domain-containing protein [Lysobacteraceae bacterium]
MRTPRHPAPPWDVERWFNTDVPLSLLTLRGKVIVLEAFQMLCPGCVSHGLPQVRRVRDAFPPGRVAVIGLHTVFEHHHAMTPDALAAFLHEYRIDFPVAVDRHDGRSPIPATMHAYGLRGTPSLVVIDAHGDVRHHAFGQIGDVELGARIGARLAEDAAAPARRCRDGACEIDATASSAAIGQPHAAVALMP